MPSEAAAELKEKRPRLESLDAFRGFTIFGMVLVIAVAAGQYQWEKPHLPHGRSWFGSLPVSTWFHADVGYALWETETREEITADVLQDPGIMSIEEVAARDDAVAKAVGERLRAMPEAKLRNIGVTFTDLIAPWFVFIVGACIPLARPREKWLWHAITRALMLIIAGIFYISLVIKQISWWWGVLQAIGVAYFCAAVLWRMPKSWRWPAVFGLGAFNLLMTEFVPWWTTAWESGKPFGTLSNPGGDWLRALTIHCQPWLSLSYGIMAMIGVLVGEAIVTRERRAIVRQCMIVGIVFTLLGWIIHRVGFVNENYSLAMNKPDVTTSFAFFTGGLGALCFLGFYYVIDILKVKAWARPLNVFGVNPLLAYFMMIVMRRVFESLGVIDFFNRVTPTNTVIMNWATFFGGGELAQWVLDFFSKAGWMGLFWGLIWTFLLWLIVVWCNRRGLFWKL